MAGLRAAFSRARSIQKFSMKEKKKSNGENGCP
jgi:hypothetical protein